MKIFLKQTLEDKYNSNNKLFEVELYKNKKFLENNKYSYRYYDFKIIEKHKNTIELIIFFKSNQKLIKKYHIDKNSLFVY